MTKFIIALISIFQYLIINAQNIIVNDSSQYGFNRPRIALLSNNVPFVIWGKPGTSAKVFGAKLIGNNFSTPVQVVPDSMSPRVGSVDGPNIVAYNDSIYVAWGNENANNHHMFLNRSFDAGNTFGQAIQVDTITPGDNIEYPGISVNNNGVLGFYFIKSDPSFLNPRQSLITSANRGNSFSPDSVVNTFAPGQPCECCQGSMEMKDNNWVFYYRNNVSNIRNAYNLVSTNSGSSFNDFYELDLVDWNIASCPTSGPEGHINGNKSFTAWMSRGSGSYRILYSVLDMALSTVSPATFIDGSVASNIAQNYPAVGGSGDTVAVIWQDNRYQFSHVFTSFSIDGGQTFNGTVLLSDTSITSNYTNGDVTFANGKFHFVWKSLNTIFYRSATIPNLLSILENNLTDEQINIFPNPANDFIEIKTILNYSSIQIIDVNGKLVKEVRNPNSKIDVSYLTKGVYFLKVTDKNSSLIKKFIKY